MTLYKLPDIDTDVSPVNLQACTASTVSDNCKVLDSNTDWVQFCFLESLCIIQLKAKTNDGLKASKELLFQ